MLTETRRILKHAIRKGGTTVANYLNSKGEAGLFQLELLVYGRTGEPCRCGASIHRLVQAGRSSFFCPVCQKKRIRNSDRPPGSLSGLGAGSLDFGAQLIVPVMHHLDGPHGAFPGAHPAAQAFGRVDVGCVGGFTHRGHLKRAHVHTGETLGAFFPDHPGHRPPHQHLGLGQDAHGPGRGALSLGDGFISIFGAMRQAAQENPIGGKVQGPQFHVGFQEKAVRIHGELENLGDLLAARMRPDCGGQH